MAKREPANGQPDEQEIAPVPRAGGATIQDRIAAFAMLDAMPESTTQAQKCLRLALIGFTNSEIASMLLTSAAVVSTNLYQERKKLKKPAPRKAKAAASEAEPGGS